MLLAAEEAFSGEGPSGVIPKKIKVEMNGHDDPLLHLPINLLKTPKKEALHQTLARKAEEGLFNASHPLLAKPSQPITGPSLAETWKEKSGVNGHPMSELFEMAKIEYDPETELATQKNMNRKKQGRKPLCPPEGMPH